MKHKKSFSERLFDTSNVMVLFFIAFISLYPFYYVFIAAISDPVLFAASKGLILWPSGFTLKGYDLVFKNPSVLIGYRNTIFYVVFGTLINMVMTSLGGYVLSRKNVKYTKYLILIIIFTMFFSGGLIPFYLVVISLGMNNSPLALIIPGAIGTTNLIIMRTVFFNIPDSLEESAKLDGARAITILIKIVLPLAKPTLAVISLFYAVGHWNAWFDAMIFLRSRKYFPISLVLREVLILNSTDTMTKLTDVSQMEEEVYKKLVQYCVIIVTTLPIIFIYPFLQRYFIKGIMIGSLKG